MPLIEVIEDCSTEAHSSSQASVDELRRTLRALSDRLALPEDLLPAFLEDHALEDARKYRDQSISILRQMSTHIHSPTWDALDEEEQVDVFFTVLRLYGTDDWTSSTTRSIIDEMTHRIDRASTALSLLNQLRPIFSTTPHPMLNETNSRALSHPAGGKSAQDDFHDSDTQSFKRKENWGIYNVLSWSTRNLSPMTLEKNIRLVLPPTLVLMDDWEPLWRLRGVMVLDSWLNHMNQDVMRRMGVDKLLMDSLIHTLSLNSSPPLKGVLRVAVNLIKKSLQGKELAEAYTQVMEKGIINGWTYAPSGMEGRKVLITIAGDLELLCTELGDGIVRWLNTIIPNLLDPLQFIPTPAVLPHYRANLSALSSVIHSVSSTGRISRWRGQIIDVLARLWVQLDERGEEDDATDRDNVQGLRKSIKAVFRQLKEDAPSVQENEFKALVHLDRATFGPLVEAS